MQLVRVPGDLPVQRRPLTVAALAGRRPRGDRRRASRAGQRGRGGRGGQPRRAARAARRLRRPRLRGSAVRDRRITAAGLDPDRAGRRHAARVRRARVPLRGRVRHGLGRRPAARPSTSRRSRRAWSRSTASSRRTARCTSTSTGGRRTTSGCCWTRCSGRSGSSTSSSGRTTTAGGPRDRWPRKHDTILWYAKGDAWVFERDAIDRVPYLAPGPGRAGEGGTRQAADRRVVDDDRPARLRASGRATRPRSRSACWSGSSRRLEPAGGSRPRSVRGQRHDRRGGGAPGSSLAARRPQPGAVAIAGARLAAETAHGPDDRGDHPRLRQHAGAGAGGRACGTSSAGPPAAMAARLGPFDVDEVRRVWAEERERQFREEVPQFREVDLGQRIVAGPRPAARDGAAARRRPLGRRGRAAPRRPRRGRPGRSRSTRGAFVDALPPPPGTARRSSRASPRATGSRSCPTGRSRRRSTATRRPPAGRRRCAAIVVSQRVGTIKPQPAIFEAARTALGDPAPGRDPARRRRLGGGRRRREAGGLARRVRPRPARRLAPARQRARRPATEDVRPDLEIEGVDELEAGLERLAAAG